MHDENVSRSNKPGPDAALRMLKDGNARFVGQSPTHPHSNCERLAWAGNESQANHAYATIISCSDSRVPVELIFDAGIMDLFVIRIAGNVCRNDEIGSIEYGMTQVLTPVLVVLGHTQCGAVTAAAHSLEGHSLSLRENIPPLLDCIKPAVLCAMEKHPELQGTDIVPYAVEENVWYGIREILKHSPAIRELVNNNKANVIGAVYNVGTGHVEWLPESRVVEILEDVSNIS